MGIVGHGEIKWGEGLLPHEQIPLDNLTQQDILELNPGWETTIRKEEVNLMVKCRVLWGVWQVDR
jgi:hypothetical protein